MWGCGLKVHVSIVLKDLNYICLFLDGNYNQIGFQILLAHMLQMTKTGGTILLLGEEMAHMEMLPGQMMEHKEMMLGQLVVELEQMQLEQKPHQRVNSQ